MPRSFIPLRGCFLRPLPGSSTWAILMSVDDALPDPSMSKTRADSHHHVDPVVREGPDLLPSPKMVAAISPSWLAKVHNRLGLTRRHAGPQTRNLA